MANPAVIVAKIDHDLLWDNQLITQSRIGKVFEYEAMMMWWGHADAVVLNAPNLRTRFRLKDDDGTIYYKGWLINDTACLVQQFVLAWAMADSGCTTIEVRVNRKWVTEIG